MILMKQGVDPNIKIKELESRIQKLERLFDGTTQTESGNQSRDRRKHRLHRKRNDNGTQEIA